MRYGLAVRTVMQYSWHRTLKKSKLVPVHLGLSEFITVDDFSVSCRAGGRGRGKRGGWGLREHEGEITWEEGVVFCGIRGRGHMETRDSPPATLFPLTGVCRSQNACVPTHPGSRTARTPSRYKGGKARSPCSA